MNAKELSRRTQPHISWATVQVVVQFKSPPPRKFAKYTQATSCSGCSLRVTISQHIIDKKTRPSLSPTHLNFWCDPMVKNPTKTTIQLNSPWRLPPSLTLLFLSWLPLLFAPVPEALLSQCFVVMTAWSRPRWLYWWYNL